MYKYPTNLANLINAGSQLLTPHGQSRDHLYPKLIPSIHSDNGHKISLVAYKFNEHIHYSEVNNQSAMKWVLLAVVASSLIVLSAQQIMCPESGITRHADPSSCTQFHLCYNGVFLEMSCANGLFFSESEQVCLPPREANCTAPQTVCPTELEPGQFVFLSNGRTCDTFFWCANMGDSVGINVGTCAPGLLFNRATLMCDPNAQCQVSQWCAKSLVSLN